MLVALEGLEGVGKTTLGKLIAARMHAAYLKSPPEEMNAVRAFVAQQSDPHCSFYFYLSSLLSMQRSIEAALRVGGIAIADRYLDSTIAYHDQGRSFEPPIFDGSRLRMPGLTIHVRCEAGERIARLKRRGFHIFDRAACDDLAIEAYFARMCDLEFWNDAPPNVSADRLARLLCERLGQDI